MCYLLKLLKKRNCKSGALKTITNIVEEDYTLHGKLEKRIPLQVHIKDFIHRYRAAF